MGENGQFGDFEQLLTAQHAEAAAPAKTLPLEPAANVAGGIQRVRYTHDAVIDMILSRPGVSQRELAAHFGYTESWLSRVINSDAFLARLADRKKELIDPGILQSIDEKYKNLASTSLMVLQEKLEASKSVDLALKTAELATKALGYGARNTGVQINQQFVAVLPEKAESQNAWLAKYGGLGNRGQVVDAQPTSGG